MMMLTKAFSILFITLMIILMLTNAIYGHWVKRLYIKAKMKTGDPKLKILCCKACTLCWACASCDILSYKEVEVQLKGIKCWILYVKLFIVNNGTTPLDMEYKVELPKGFKCNSYFLGPYKTAELNLTAIMKDIMNCNWLSEPPDLNIGEGFVALHVIKPGCFNLDKGVYNGLIEYTGRFNSWITHAYITLSFNITSLCDDN